MDLTEAGPATLLAAAVLMLVRDLLTRRSSSSLGREIGELKVLVESVLAALERAEQMHLDSDSKFSTVGFRALLEDIDSKLQRLLDKWGG